MAVELSSHDLLRLKVSLDETLKAAQFRYRKLRKELQEHDPAVSQERIEAIKTRWLASGIKPDAKEESLAALSCAHFELAYKAGTVCFQAMASGKATARTVVNSSVNGWQVWRALGGVALALNGGPVRQDFFDEAFETLHQQDPVLMDLQRSLDVEYSRQSKRGMPVKTPSQRELAELSGYDRKTVGSRFPFLRFLAGVKVKK